jgi:hypothetical protein
MAFQVACNCDLTPHADPVNDKVPTGCVGGRGADTGRWAAAMVLPHVLENIIEGVPAFHQVQTDEGGYDR